MNPPLPTAEELEKLPLRAVVAYAARTTRRLSSALQGVVPDEVLNDALRLVDVVSAAKLICGVDQVSVITAAEHVAEAYAAAATDVKSLEKFRIVFSFIHAALAAMHAVEAAANPERARHEMNLAARAAERAVRPIDALGDISSRAAAEAARQDYDVLLRVYGEHDEVIIGEPVDCFDKRG